MGPSDSSAWVFCSMSSAAASRAFGRDVDGLGADEALELRLELADPLDVRLLAGKQVLGRRHVLQPERLELLGHVRLRLAQLLFHVGAAAQAAIDVDVAELLLQLVAPAQPQGDGREDRTDDGDEEPDELQLGRDLERQEGPGDERAAGDQQAHQHEDDRHARQRPPCRLGRDLEGDLDLARQRCFQFADPAVELAESLDNLAQDRQRVGDGWTVGERRQLGRRLRPPRGYRSKRSWAAVRSAVSRSAWRAFSSIDRRSARAVSDSTRRSRALASVSRSRSSCVSAVSPCSSDALAWASAVLGDLEPAGVLVALRRQLEDARARACCLARPCRGRRR